MIVWTDYLRYRADLRGFDLDVLEQILRYSSERYVDAETGRQIVVGRHDTRLVMVAYEEPGGNMVPVTVHAISRQQITFRLRMGRFINE